MKVYLAAPWARRNEACAVAATIETMGFEITRRWWEYEVGDTEHEKLAEQAAADLQAVADADIVVVLQLEKSEGKAVETGYALGLELPVIVYSPEGYANIFHHLPDVYIYSSLEAVMEELLNARANFEDILSAIDDRRCGVCGAEDPRD